MEGCHGDGGSHELQRRAASLLCPQHCPGHPLLLLFSVLVVPLWHIAGGSDSGHRGCRNCVSSSKVQKKCSCLEELAGCWGLSASRWGVQEVLGCSKGLSAGCWLVSPYSQLFLPIPCLNTLCSFCVGTEKASLVPGAGTACLVSLGTQEAHRAQCCLLVWLQQFLAERQREEPSCHCCHENRRTCEFLPLHGEDWGLWLLLKACCFPGAVGWQPQVGARLPRRFCCFMVLCNNPTRLTPLRLGSACPIAAALCFLTSFAPGWECCAV